MLALKHIQVHRGKFRIFPVIAFIPLWLSACTSVNTEEEIAAVKATMQEVHEAHLAKDAIKWFSVYPDSWIDVRDGVLAATSKEIRIPGVQDYLDNMEFLELEKGDPVIQISKDGAMASYANTVILKGVLQEEPIYGKYAWLSVLEKQENRWQIISHANTALPDADLPNHILRRVRQSLGGPAIDNIRSIHALADCNGPNGTFRTLLYSSAENVRFEQVSDRGRFKLKVGEEGSWIADPNGEISTNPDSSFHQFAYGHELHWLIFQATSRYDQAAYRGITEFQQQSAFFVQFKDATGSDVNFYYSFEDFKPLGYTIFPAGDEGVHVVYQDWREVEGIQIPYRALFLQGNETFTYEFSEISWNQLSASDFDRQDNLVEW